VGEAQKEHIDSVQRVGSYELQSRPTPEVGVREVQELTVQPLAGDLPHVEPRMTKQQTEELTSGVTGATDDGDCDGSRGHGPWCQFPVISCQFKGKSVELRS
jgi:hypothetical protein